MDAVRASAAVRRASRDVVALVCSFGWLARLIRGLFLGSGRYGGGTCMTSPHVGIFPPHRLSRLGYGILCLVLRMATLILG